MMVTFNRRDFLLVLSLLGLGGCGAKSQTKTLEEIEMDAVAAIEEYMQTEEAQLLLSDERDAKSHQYSIRIDLPAHPPNP